MKNTNISELPMHPEEYQVDHYARVDYNHLHSIMEDSERRFINGLIRWYEPESILEIGVHRGGGTVNILNAISDRDAELVSIDQAEICLATEWQPESWWGVEWGTKIMVGDNVARSGVRADKWRLITGREPSEALEELDLRFDFCVIDTDHRHPVESLNFLCVLPFLNDGAIVVLHDTTLYLNFAAEQCFANRILMMTVCADKLEPINSTLSFTGYPNIVAFQVTPATRKYVRNVFDSLMLPWEEVSVNTAGIGAFISRHYSSELASYYDQAVELQKRVKRITFLKQLDGHILTHKSEKTWFNEWRCLGSGVIFYGAGGNMRYLLETGQELGWHFDCPIWDINAEQIGEINGCPVSKPDFAIPAQSGERVCVTIDDPQVFTRVQGQLVPLGYRVFHGLRELIRDMRNSLPDHTY